MATATCWGAGAGSCTWNVWPENTPCGTCTLYVWPCGVRICIVMPGPTPTGTCTFISCICGWAIMGWATA